MNPFKNRSVQVGAIIVGGLSLSLFALSYDSIQEEREREARAEERRQEEVAREARAAERAKTPEPPPTIEEEFRTLTAGSTPGFFAAQTVLDMDAQALYHQVRPSICDSLALTTIPAVEATLVESLRREGIDEKQSENMAEGLVTGTIKHGNCDA